MDLFSLFGSVGLLFVALLGFALLCFDLGWLLFPGCARHVRLLGGSVWGTAGLVGLLQLLFHLNGLFPGVLGAALLVSTAGAHLLRRRKRPGVKIPQEVRALSKNLGPVEAVAAVGLGILAAGVYLLPVWQWDSLGYHLPFVNFVLQGGGKTELPIDVPYLSTYPRNVELLFVALRASLPDDRLVDVGQIPLGLLSALTVGALAREFGASLPWARVAGCAFLTLPAIFLQMPTNYIDVGVAAFYLLAALFIYLPATNRSLLTAGLAVGLYLGTKPNTPPAAFLLGAVLLIRAWRSGNAGVGLIALCLSGALGLEAYVVQLVRNHNPVWPAIVHLGPIELPGTISVDELLGSGAGTQKVHGPMPLRILLSWSSMDAAPVFDMRKGGLGPLFWIALPLAGTWIVRSRSWLLGVLLAISLVTPDPAVVRYIMPFPGLVLAAAAAYVSTSVWAREMPRAAWKRRGALGLVALICSWNLFYAVPGLTGEGPSLFKYVRMTRDERARAVGADGRPDRYIDVRRRLTGGDVTVFDRSLSLPYLTWKPDLSNEVRRVPDDASAEAVLQLLNKPEVRLVFLSDEPRMHEALRQANPPFRQVFPCEESCFAFIRP